MDTSGNTVLITGGATGIGLALAENLVERGNEVIVCGRRRDKLDAAKAKVPRLHVRACDVTDSRARTSLVKWAMSTFPALNVLVNNAGIQRAVDLHAGARDLDDADAEIATNLTAPLHLAALVVSHFRTKDHAAIVNVTSGLAFTPLAAVPVYCATKAALHSLSVTLRHQLRDTSVRVFEVAPPMVATELSGRRRSADPAAMMTAAEVANGLLAAMEKDVYEVALGGAANLREQREALFPVLNA
jgi:uncharacterized oxidoreductase